LKTTDDNKGPIGSPVAIKPVAFRPGRGQRGPQTASRTRWIIGCALALLLIMLCTSAWFVFTARQVVIRVEPEPDLISIQGTMAAPKFGEHFLLRPGEYRLKAERQCFRPLDEGFRVSDAKSQNFVFSMTRLPGLLTVKTHRVDDPAMYLEGATIIIDGQEVGQSPAADLEVKPGRRAVIIRSEKYEELATAIDVSGCGTRQALDLALVPGWSNIEVDSVPTNAVVTVNGQAAGATPLILELAAGEHELVLTAARFKPWREIIVVKANEPRSLETIHLQPADGILTVQTDPVGANVMIGGKFAGRTPLEVNLSPEIRHVIDIYKTGYEKANRKVKLTSAEIRTLTIALKPKLGVINFTVEPPDAEIVVDGKSMGRVPKQMQLLAVEHQLEIRKPGYQTYRTRITPRPGFAQQIKIRLAAASSGKTDARHPLTMIKAKNGYAMKLIRPRGYTMGSSRREQGRRSNETLRSIDLQRPFYIGLREVTNKEFRQYSSNHHSGEFKSHNLNSPELPVAGVTWEQAALFCNWLSTREGLPPIYVLKGGQLVSANPVGIGYRLPTEAEWEYCARFDKEKVDLKYPWGNHFPPGPKSGNFADESARDLLALYLMGYNDGHPAIAPPEKFKANLLGLYDLGGNAAEWCHDYYSIYPYDAAKVYRDPVGPAEGKHHVIRGSSWQQSSISALRSAYRDYSDGKRVDLGFRVARYLK
jgi:formylglycine-generating enzyme required for sulfatase activity